MSNRAPQFERRSRDGYPTPAAAVASLLPWLPPRTRFVEPCPGAGALVGHLTGAGHVCVGAYDLPNHDARTASCDVPEGAVFCTNPPFWGRLST
jgi:hypothetical protein